MTPALRWGLRIALATGALVLAVLAGEVVLRGLDPPRRANPSYFAEWSWIVLDPVLSWVNEPGQHEHFEVNSLGFRGRELELKKPAGSVRIVCLGDSGTFGIWKKTEEENGYDNYPEELGQMLRSRGHAEIEVVNAGVLGYSTSHGLRQLVTQVLPLAPDIVTVRLGFNDHALSWDPRLRALEPDSPIARSAFYALADWRVVGLGLVARQRTRLLHPDPWSVVWTDPERFEQNLRRMTELARAHDFHLLLLDYPLRPIERGESPGQHPGIWKLLGVEDLADLHRQHTAYQQRLARIARETGTPLVDTARICQRAESRCHNQADLVHLDRSGVRETATLVADELERLGWLEPRDGST